MSTTARRRHPRNAAATRARIVDHAFRAFAERGFEGVGLDEVAERAGVRKATLFYYFASKAELYAEVAARVVEHWAPLGLRLASEKPSPEGFEAVAGEIHDRLAASPEAARLLIREALDRKAGAANAAMEPLLRVGEAYLRRGQRSGVFTRELDARGAMDALLGAISLYFLNPTPYRPGQVAASAADLAAHRKSVVAFVSRAVLRLQR